MKKSASLPALAARRTPSGGNSKKKQTSLDMPLIGETHRSRFVDKAKVVKEDEEDGYEVGGTLRSALLRTKTEIRGMWYPNG